MRIEIYKCNKVEREQEGEECASDGDIEQYMQDTRFALIGESGYPHLRIPNKMSANPDNFRAQNLMREFISQ